MDADNDRTDVDPEIEAIRVVYDTVKELNQEAQIRVIQYVTDKLGIPRDLALSGAERVGGARPAGGQILDESKRAEGSAAAAPSASEGISPVAERWMSRNGLAAAQLGSIFSLGGDEIDLVADSVPGKSKRQKMLNVIRLKGVAAYLGTGAARVSYEQIKEACMHYDAYDRPNFAKHLKEFAAEVSGTKESGYTLTARGLSAGTKLLKQKIETESS